MSQVCQYLIPSENSAAYHHLATAETALTGKKNPIEIPLISLDLFRETLGEKVAEGNYGAIYKVQGVDRVYKVLSYDQFKNGNEILISKIASDCGVAPTFHSAFLVQQRSSVLVVIEMDNAGKSLGKLMEKLAPPPEELKEEEKPLSEEEEFMKKMREMFIAQGHAVGTETIQKPKLSVKDAVIKIYGSKETFYFKLFSQIKKLAEHNISYRDSHVGNIMPNYGIKKGLKADKDLQLIDFDKAKIMPNPQSAALTALRSSYNQIHLEAFQDLPDLSEESKGLIAWFNAQRPRLFY